MKRSITIAVVAAAPFALAGCGTGMYSQTADQVAAVPGINVTAPGPQGNGTVSVRNATVAYAGVDGYKSGSVATVKIWLFNDTPNPVTVVVKTDAGAVENSQVKIEPNQFAKPDVKIKLERDLRNVESLPVQVEFVGVHQFEIELPVEPPNAPAPGHTIEFEQPTGEH